MSRSTITFASDTVKDFAANPKRDAEYKSTIQNLTDQTITITVTNERIQSGTPTFGTPSQGAVAITAGTFASINEPYSGWRLTAGVAATGDVVIMEAG